MTKRTLIVNASPRIHGDTATLIEAMKSELKGEIIELSAFRSKIAPCVDCRRCATTARCVIRDDMDLIYADDFDNVVLGTPVYYATLPGPMLGLMSRFQPQRAAKYNLGKPVELRPKKGGLILAAGSKGNEDKAVRPAGIFFRMVNATGYKEHLVQSVHTDTVPAREDVAALEAARALGRWLSEE